MKLIAAFCAIAAFTGSISIRADHHKAHRDANSTAAVTAGASSHEMSDKDKGATDRLSSQSGVRRASDHANAKKLGELKGKKVMGSDGEKLGDLHDFVLDAKTGEIAHAVVSTGGLLGVGDKLRVVAHDSLEHDADGLSVQMDKSAFEALPTVEEEELKAGKVSAKATPSSPDWQGASASPSGSVTDATTQPADVSGASSANSDASASMHASGNFILASELVGKELRAGDEGIGTIEDVAIDLQQGTAMAVVKVKSDTAGGDDLFHVPFGSLQIASAHSQSVSTTLARADFTPAMSTSGVAATTPSGVSDSDESLTPTGRTSNDPAAVASETTEPYGATAESSPASTVSPDITAGADASASVGRTPASAPGGAMTATPGHSSPASSTTSNIPSVDTNTSADSRSVADVRGSTDASSSASVAGPGTTETLTTEDEQLTPTGRDHGSDLMSTAAAIRSALNSEQTLASEDVKVQEAGRKIMLQGKVSSEEAKERIETLAKQAAGSAEIDSKLKVKDQE